MDYKFLEKLANEGELITSWESELVQEQIYAQIIDAAYANRVGRQILKPVQLNAGSALNFELETKNSITFNRVAETGLLLKDVENYTEVIVTPVKYGCSVAIAREAIEDMKWDVIKRNLTALGIQAGLKEDALVVAAMADSTYGFYAGTGSSHRVTTTGTELDIVDIVNAIVYPRTDDCNPNIMLLNPKQEGELNQIDTFVEADKVGNRTTFEKGFIGRIYGLDCIISSSCTADRVYILDTSRAGVIVIRRDLSTSLFEVPERDSRGIACTFREAAQVLYPEAGCDIVVS